MTTSDPTRPMTGDEMVALTKRHTLFEWSAQAAVDPIPVARAKGIYFWTPEGKRFIDFNSQLMCVNIGHGDPRVIEAIQEQADVLAYANPFMATEPRARLGREARRDHAGRHRHVLLHERRRRGERERDQDRPRLHRAGDKILARYRSYHGATAGAITLTGDPRRWAAEPGLPGVVHVLDPYHGIARGWDTAEQALADARGGHPARRDRRPIAAFILEPVTGTNGILVPPDGYLQGVRELCTRHGILMIADEVMSGFGRTGEWFAVDHWKVVPDLMTMAKGLTSAYVPLGAVGMRHADRRSLPDQGVLRRAHLQQPPARLRRGARDARRLRRGPADRERATHGRRDEGAARRPRAPPPVGRRRPVDRPVRRRRTGAQTGARANRSRRSTAPPRR